MTKEITGKLKGKAFPKEVYLFKKKHPIRYWLGKKFKQISDKLNGKGTKH